MKAVQAWQEEERRDVSSQMRPRAEVPVLSAPNRELLETLIRQAGGKYIAAPTRELLETLIRYEKGVIIAWEKWLHTS